ACRGARDSGGGGASGEVRLSATAIICHRARRPRNLRAMDPTLESLVKQLDLETLEVNLFRGQSADLGGRSVFGGQVIGQAMVAASRTVDGRSPHWLHAYF